MWKLEREEDYFRIYDSKNQIAGYLDPDYGDLFPPENQEKIIEKMLHDHDFIHGCFLMFPMVKFEIFNTKQFNIDSLESHLTDALKRILEWKNFLQKFGITDHWIQVSHTDQDMLSITIPKKFSKPTKLEKKELLSQILPILDNLHKSFLL